MIRTFSEAVKFLEHYIPTKAKKHPGEFGLRRMEYLMELLGNPQLKYPTIHVGGTSGKGSTATIIASILATKYKVGLHTSPHLVSITERIRIYGFCYRHNFAEVGMSFFRTSQVRSTPVPPAHSWYSGTSGRAQKDNASPQNSSHDISDRNFVDLVNYIKPFVERVERSKFGSPSYFEIVSAMAFLYFYLQKVDIAVIEVGMGGRYDATNVVKSLVAVLTNVGLDHTEILGDTVEKIAEDKVGIIKSGMQVVSGVKQPSVIDIVKSKCKAQRAKLSLLIPPPRKSAPHTIRGDSEAFSYKVRNLDSEGSVFDYKGDKLLKDLKLSLLGEHQVENAALAIKTIEKLSVVSLPAGEAGCQLSEENIRKGLKVAFIPGRLEVIKRNPLLILDGAHNPDKMNALVQSIKTIFPKKKVTAILAIKEDKKAEEMLRQLLEISDKIIFTYYQITTDVGEIKSFEPEELLQITQQLQDKSNKKYKTNLRVEKSLKKAYLQVIASAKKDDLILVTGSLYLVGEIKKIQNLKLPKILPYKNRGYSGLVQSPGR